MIVRLDKYVQDKIKAQYGVSISRSYVERILEAGGVKLNDEIIKKKGFSFDDAKHQPVLDEKVISRIISVYQTGKQQNEEADAWDNSEEGIEIDQNRLQKAGDIRPHILFEDDDILVTYKPPGVLSHPGRGDRGSDSMVYQYIKYMHDTHNYIPRAGLLHRLDRETQGILLFAKNMQTYNEVKSQFETRRIEKYYVAICEVTPQLNNGLRRKIAEARQQGLFTYEQLKTLKSFESVVEQVTNSQKPLELIGYIGRKKGTPYMVYTPDKKQASKLVGTKNCESDVYVLSEEGTQVILLFAPHTGRTHQIRAQARYLGAPVQNDPIYGFNNTSGGILGLYAIGVKVGVKGVQRSFFTTLEHI